MPKLMKWLMWSNDNYVIDIILHRVSNQRKINQTHLRSQFCFPMFLTEELQITMPSTICWKRSLNRDLSRLCLILYTTKVPMIKYLMWKPFSSLCSGSFREGQIKIYVNSFSFPTDVLSEAEKIWNLKYPVFRFLEFLHIQVAFPGKALNYHSTRYIFQFAN